MDTRSPLRRALELSVAIRPVGGRRHAHQARRGRCVSCGRPLRAHFGPRNQFVSCGVTR